MRHLYPYKCFLQVFICAIYYKSYFQVFEMLLQSITTLTNNTKQQQQKQKQKQQQKQQQQQPFLNL